MMAKAKNWAIVVGINQYANIGHLKYANRDAEAMAAFFRSANFDRVFCFADELEITPEPDQRSTQPTSSGLVDFLHDRFTTQTPPLKAGDNCWFFFAGHGKRLENRDCLLPQDYNPRIPEHEKRAIPVELVREALLRSGADNVILLLDACRTEGDRDGDDGIGDAQPGAITIFSCERNKKAYEIDALRHGAFTAALLEGLRMPKSAENCATVQRLDRHLRHRVPELCQQHPERPVQQPNTTVDPGQKWYFLLLPKVATEQDIAALKMEAFKTLQFEKNLDLAELLWKRVNGAAQGDDPDAVQALQDIAVQRALNPKQTAPSPQSSPAVSPTASRSAPAPAQPPKQPIFSFESITVDATGRETQRQPGSAQYFSEDLGHGVMLDMVLVPGGRFQMGAVQGEEGASDDEYPQHGVTVAGFPIGKFAVTQAQWKAVTQFPQVKIALEADPSRFKGAARPVEQVSWNEAIEFCERLSRHTRKTYRLPSEAQWEYACRAGTSTPFHFGKTITTDLVNFDGKNYSAYAKATKGEYRQTTTEVGIFSPNAFGLYDMHGNVWEWCMDTWHRSYIQAPSHGSAWLDKGSEYRLARGGSWPYLPRGCRSADRSHIDPALRSGSLGFRVVCLPS
jgi:formylglycine-generating enzyme required for sulfatase activity/uncharacterized caspase-like protein